MKRWDHYQWSAAAHPKADGMCNCTSGCRQEVYLAVCVGLAGCRVIFDLALLVVPARAVVDDLGVGGCVLLAGTRRRGGAPVQGALVAVGGKELLCLQVWWLSAGPVET